MGCWDNTAIGVRNKEIKPMRRVYRHNISHKSIAEASKKKKTIERERRDWICASDSVPVK